MLRRCSELEVSVCLVFYFGLVDLTLHTDLAIASWAVEVGSLTEAFVLRREEQERRMGLLLDKLCSAKQELFSLLRSCES